ncbi:Adaptin N terminal region family protein [Histomonas meleagridis]|uniref:Adaptin N terminal region family protein n=1 Tax=Histomonas meleagridis TaxID=135588 RepID=UPI00355A7FF8|nr:Adaptin N terminal region family protein [Histomonas meleagridis]
MHGQSIEAKVDVMQQLIFLNIQQHDTAWADFYILEVMSMDNYSAKRVAYTAAEICWKPTSDVVLMAINLIQHDLISGNPLLVSVVLSSIPSFLSPALAEQISKDVIQLMNSSKPYLRQKAIFAFFHICLKFPEALRPGFSSLQSHLNDDDISVVYATLTVICELCKINPKNFISFIPKLCKMLETTRFVGVSLRLLEIVRMLIEVEPRLPKKLVQPLTIILETSSSMSVNVECMKTILSMPSTNQRLISLISYRIQTFIQSSDPNYRFIFLSYFIQLMKSYPKLVVSNRELIMGCVNSGDEFESLLALDLLGDLANSKTIDSIVAMMFKHFKSSNIITYRDTLLKRVIEICSKNDYELVTDFDWYISVLTDFIEEGNFSCFNVLSNQLIDLVTRVPDTRKRIIEEMCKLFDNPSNMGLSQLLLTALHIIGEYSENSEPFSKVLQPIVANCDDRVQAACIGTSFVLYLKAESNEKFEELETLFQLKLPMFQQSEYPEIQERAYSILGLVEICKTLRGNENDSFDELRNYIFSDDKDEEIEVPKDELSIPLTIFNKTKSSKTTKRKHHRKGKRKQKKLSFDEIPDEKVDENVTSPDTEKVEEPVKVHPAVTKWIKRKERRHHNRNNNNAEPKDIDMPITGPSPNSRHQILARNQSIIISISKIVPLDKHGQLEFTIQINNESSSVIPSIGFTLIETSHIKSVDISPLTIGIGPSSSIMHSFVISVDNPYLAQAAKFIIVPNGGGVDSLETRIVVFPSYFLVPSDESSLDIFD